MSLFTWFEKVKNVRRYFLRKHRTSVVVLAALAGLSVFATSSSSHTQLKPLRVAMWGEYMPLHGFAQGKAVGFEADLARHLAGVYRSVVFIDPREKGLSSIEAVARGEADIALNAITPTPERERLVGFTKPYLILHYRVLSRPDKRLTNALDLSSTRVVAPEGPAFVALRELVGAKALSAPSFNAAVDLLKKGEVDFVFGEEVGLIAAGQGTDFILTGPSLGKTGIAAAVPKSAVMRYNELLRNLNVTALPGLIDKWRPSIDPAKSDGLAVSPEPRVKDEGLRQFEQSFKHAVKSNGINAPITGLEKRIAECAFARSNYPSTRCKETLERVQGVWEGAWPTVFPITRKDEKKRYAHVFIGNNVSIGPEVCDPTRPKGKQCRPGEGSTWTAHTRTGHVRATLDELRFEPYETPEGTDSDLVAYFKIEQRQVPLFLSTMPLRVGTRTYVEAEKQRIEQKAIPESVRRSFRDRILRTPDWIEKEWHAYRVPGSDEFIALVVSESTGEPRGYDLIIALVHWTGNGNVDLLFRYDFLPSRYGDAIYCGYPQLTVDVFFDFDGDGDLDVALKNRTETASAPYLLMRVDGGYRAREFKFKGGCVW